MSEKIKQYFLNFRENHPRYMDYIGLYGFVWFFMFLFDAHKYGCWLTQDATYWYPVSYWLVPLSLLPFLPAVLSAWVRWAEMSGKQYTYKFVLLWIPGIIILVCIMSGGHIFQAEWWDKTILNGSLRNDSSLYCGIGLVVFLSWCIWLCLKRGINPFDL